MFHYEFYIHKQCILQAAQRMLNMNCVAIYESLLDDSEFCRWLRGEAIVVFLLLWTARPCQASAGWLPRFRIFMHNTSNLYLSKSISSSSDAQIAQPRDETFSFCIGKREGGRASKIFNNSQGKGSI